MTEKEYREYPALNHSTLKLFMQANSPKHFKYLLTQQDDSDEKNYGSLVHCLALEPDKIDDEFLVIPKIDRRSKAGKEAYELAMRNPQNKTVVSEDQMQSALALVNSLEEREEWQRLMDKVIEKEKVVIRSETHALGNIDLKCRIDFITRNSSKDLILWDLKTTKSIKPHAFKNSFLDYGYATQAAFYQMLYSEPNVVFKFFIVEKMPPYSCAVVEMSSEDMIRARHKVSHYIGKYILAKQKGFEEDPVLNYTIQLPMYFDEELYEEV